MKLWQKYQKQRPEEICWCDCGKVGRWGEGKGEVLTSGRHTLGQHGIH